MLTFSSKAVVTMGICTMARTRRTFSRSYIMRADTMGQDRCDTAERHFSASLELQLHWNSPCGLQGNDTKATGNPCFPIKLRPITESMAYYRIHGLLPNPWPITESMAFARAQLLPSSASQPPPPINPRILRNFCHKFQTCLHLVI